MTKTRVLVTGATGKIGGAVAKQLLENGVAWIPGATMVAPTVQLDRRC